MGNTLKVNMQTKHTNGIVTVAVKDFDNVASIARMNGFSDIEVNGMVVGYATNNQNGEYVLTPKATEAEINSLFES